MTLFTRSKIFIITQQMIDIVRISEAINYWTDLSRETGL